MLRRLLNLAPTPPSYRVIVAGGNGSRAQETLSSPALSNAAYKRLSPYSRAVYQFVKCARRSPRGALRRSASRFALPSEVLWILHLHFPLGISFIRGRMWECRLT